MSTSSEWVVSNTRFDAASLAQHRSAFAISNGFLGLSGHVIGDRDGPWPLTIIAGIYDELDMFGQILSSAREPPWLDESFFDTACRSPSVAALPDEIALGCGDVQAFEQSLLLHSGVYAYVYDFRDRAGRTTRVESQRFASMQDPGRVYMRVMITPRDHNAPIRVISGIDADVRSNLTRERQFEVVDRAAGTPESCRLTVRTPARGHMVSLSVEHRVEEGPTPSIRSLVAADAVCSEFEFPAKAGQRIVLDRSVEISTESQAAAAGATSAEHASPAPSLSLALHANLAAWKSLWELADVQIDGDPESQRNLRFCIFHLLAAGPRWQSAASVPVKLLTGQFYQGNTFWDTDLYIVPFYTFVAPELARACVRYRIAGLSHGRAIAQRWGFRGAKLAWQAGFGGEECLGDWYWFTRTNIHINADAAYCLMQLVGATGDMNLLKTGGDELLIEAARFYASRAKALPGSEAWDFEDVAGPDEGHCHSRTNFYTNFLAARTLEWAAELAENPAVGRLPSGPTSIEVEPDEPALWRRIAAGLRLLFDPRTGVYEQCAGFFGLKPLPTDFLSRRTAWFEPVWEYQAMNQPDVLMAMMLFGERFNEKVLRANWDCYRDRSLNFSSMSFVVHAIIAARLGDAETAFRNFRVSAGMDLDDSLTGRRDTYMGLHGTALGGAWLAAVFGIGGVQIPVGGPGDPVSLRIEPCLPAQWRRLRFNLLLQGERLCVSVDREGVEIQVGNSASLSLSATIAGQELTLKSDHTYRINRANAPPAHGQT
ncbi:MAG: glycoside hydrolase family 65 protein [Planctomycetes bacterium]|nr:glycoside hydrolase family 65 protein [Planctomycetota bacterium]